MPDLIKLIRQEGLSEGTFAHETGDRNEPLRHCEGFSQLPDDAQKLISQVRRGEKNSVLLYLKNAFLLFEHKEGGEPDPTNNNKRVGYQLYRYSLQNYPGLSETLLSETLHQQIWAESVSENVQKESVKKTETPISDELVGEIRQLAELVRHNEPTKWPENPPDKSQTPVSVLFAPKMLWFLVAIITLLVGSLGVLVYNKADNIDTQLISINSEKMAVLAANIQTLKTELEEKISSEQEKLARNLAMIAKSQSDNESQLNDIQISLGKVATSENIATLIASVSNNNRDVLEAIAQEKKTQLDKIQALLTPVKAASDKLATQIVLVLNENREVLRVMKDGEKQLGNIQTNIQTLLDKVATSNELATLAKSVSDDNSKILDKVKQGDTKLGNIQSSLNELNVTSNHLERQIASNSKVLTQVDKKLGEIQTSLKAKNNQLAKPQVSKSEEPVADDENKVLYAMANVMALEAVKKFVGKEGNDDTPVKDKFTRFLENFKMALTLAEKIKPDGTMEVEINFDWKTTVSTPNHNHHREGEKYYCLYASSIEGKNDLVGKENQKTLSFSVKSIK